MKVSSTILKFMMCVVLIAMLTGEVVASGPNVDATMTVACQNFDPKQGPLASVGGKLAALYCDDLGVSLSYASPGLTDPSGFQISLVSEPTLPPVIVGPNGEALVVVDATPALGVSSSDLLAELRALGLQDGVAFGPVVSGKLPVSAIAAAADLTSLNFARPALATTNAGLATSQGDAAMVTDDVRANVGVDGTGITVGTLSDSYDCLGGAATDITNDDLPSGAYAEKDEDGCASGTDEGRAMMQLIHDVVPGAGQVFHTAFGGQGVFASGIITLSGVAEVIVDDVSYYAEPFFQDGIIAQAVYTATTINGDSYFSSAGNSADQSYESAYRSSGITDPLGWGEVLHDFDSSAATDAYQQITVPVGEQIIISLQWDEPYASASGSSGSTNDLDLFITDAAQNVLAASADLNVGGDPIEVAGFYNDGSIDEDGIPGADTQFQVAIGLFSGTAPSLMKYIYWTTSSGVGVDEYVTNSSTVFGHSNAADAEAVGAAFYYETPEYGQDPPLLEPFSSIGVTPILFDRNGNRLATPEIREKPGIVAPDGTNTTFFGTDISHDADTDPNFFGTSAAAPHAAALAALLLSYDNTLTPTEQYALMEATAIDMDATGFDNNTGWGLVQGDFIGADFSDLPSTYGYAWHAASSGSPLEFGSQWTGDTSFADGQDDGNDDGVAPTSGVQWTPSSTNGSVDVTVAGCGGTCYVNAWVDFDNSGAFGDSASEQILTDRSVSNGTASLSGFSIPSSPACFDGNCTVRFRLSTETSLDATGRAADGEVSDFVWSFGPNAVGLAAINVQVGLGFGLAAGSVLLGVVALMWVTFKRKCG